MTHSLTIFATKILTVVLASFLLVASVAFITIPWSLGGHPGDAVTGMPKVSFHPS